MNNTQLGKLKIAGRNLSHQSHRQEQYLSEGEIMRSSTISSNLAIIEASGYITAANADDFQQGLTTAVTSKEYAVFLIDMSQVEFLDSAGLMALVSAFRLAQSLGKRFSICSIAPSVRIIFELTQLDRVCEIFNSRDEFSLLLKQHIAA